jgi:glycosyltransferase involved in cell wall biosynthesis
LGGIPLVITQEVNGLLVDPGDVEGLAAAIMELVSQREKRETLGRAARKAIVERFNWDQVTDQILKMIPLPAG